MLRKNVPDRPYNYPGLSGRDVNATFRRAELASQEMTEAEWRAQVLGHVWAQGQMLPKINTRLVRLEIAVASFIGSVTLVGFTYTLFLVARFLNGA